MKSIVSWAAALRGRSEDAYYEYGKCRLRKINRRDQVFFGASVTYARAYDDAEVTITIVGVDEAEAEAGRISWVAPVARALLGARVGDMRRLRTPAGQAPKIS
jgi:transcription elongation factor GreB